MPKRKRAPQPIVFLAHAHEDAAAACALQVWIERSLLQAVQVFCASNPDDLEIGVRWEQEIRRTLRQSALYLCLLTPTSWTRGWVFFEAGVGYGRGLPVVPLVCGGLKVADLKPPFGMFQGLRLPGKTAERRLLKRLASEAGLVAPANPEPLKLPPISGRGTPPGSAPSSPEWRPRRSS